MAENACMAEKMIGSRDIQVTRLGDTLNNDIRFPLLSNVRRKYLSVVCTYAENNNELY